jgi:hypothetical protein
LKECKNILSGKFIRQCFAFSNNLDVVGSVGHSPAANNLLQD